jgi:cytoskeletal protein RodZ
VIEALKTMTKKRVIFSWIGIIVVIGFVSLVLSLLITPHEPPEMPASNQPIPKLSPPSTTDRVDPESSQSSSLPVSKQPAAISPSEETVQEDTSTIQPVSPPAVTEADNNSVQESQNASDKKDEEKQLGIIRTLPNVIKHLPPANTTPLPNEQQAVSMGNGVPNVKNLNPSRSHSQNSEHEIQVSDVNELLKPQIEKPSEPIDKIGCSDLDKTVGDKNNDLEMGWAKVGYEILQLEQEGESLITSLCDNSN